MGAKGHEPLSIVAEYEGDCGDDAGLQDADARPDEEECDRAAKRAQEAQQAAARARNDADSYEPEGD